MGRPRNNEADVAAHAVAFLEDCGCDVYQEVTLYPQGPIADIVALAGPEVWIVEVKALWSLALIEQLLDRKAWAHRVFAAVPTCPGWHRRAELCRAIGFGAIEIADSVATTLREPSWTGRFFGDLPPRLTSRFHLPIRKILADGHKTHARAGTVGGGRYTPFRRTCEALRSVVHDQPGLSMREAVDRLKANHYSSPATARTSLLGWVRAGKVAGVRLESRDGSLRLFPSEATT